MRLVLDTNVISELQKPLPEPRVVEWLDRQAPLDVFLSAVTVAELEFGLAAMPEGKRRDALAGAVAAIVDTDFAGRVLPFDRAAARLFGARMSAARLAGTPVGIADGMIGATALRHDCAVASRDLAPFAALGVEVVDPWDAG